MILVTGGAGFIGSHVCLALLQAGRPVLVLDDFSQGRPEALARVQALAGRALVIEAGDVRDAARLDALIARHRPTAAVHLAGLKSVADSVSRPADYLDVNLGGTRALAAACLRGGVRRLVFSSSASVYGDGHASPIAETAACRPANPYGRSKWLAEEALREAAEAAEGPGLAVAALRYFNAAGAHESGQLGEAPRGAPANLFAVLAEAALAPAPVLRVFGRAHATRDGSCERDYVHVQDLAEAHLAVLGRLEAHTEKPARTAPSTRPAFEVFNLGRGHGHTVLEVHRAFEAATGRAIRLEDAPARPGDLASYFADPSLAARELGWRATRGLARMAGDAWRWRSGPGAGAIIPPLTSEEHE